MQVQTGLDVAIDADFDRFAGQTIGLVCNQASISSDLRHFVDALLPGHRSGKFRIAAVFGPQHGLFGHTQDNMVEWEGGLDDRTGLTVYSLYGERREPTAKSLEGIDRLVVDLPDVGSRYYTFIWTLALVMKACEPLAIPVTVLDRPNPIGGLRVEGPVMQPEFASFVGLYPLPARHGMTLGEIARYLREQHFPKVDLDVVSANGWRRAAYFEQTGLPWAMPSPNMPTVDTALVYPGMCLLEGTNLSEGRGTTQPFEIFGAPFVDGWRLADQIDSVRLPGVRMRPIVFEPTFQKHARQTCGGCVIHVTNRREFEPVATAVAILQCVASLYPGKFSWNPPPYEYEFDKLPIDILAGNDWLRPAIERRAPLAEIRERWRAEDEQFEPARRSALIYAA